MSTIPVDVSWPEANAMCYSVGLKRMVPCGSTARPTPRPISRPYKKPTPLKCRRGVCYSAGLKKCVKCGSTAKPKPKCSRGLCYSAGLKRCVKCGSTSVSRPYKTQYKRPVPPKFPLPNLKNPSSNPVAKAFHQMPRAENLYGQPLLAGTDLGYGVKRLVDWIFGTNWTGRKPLIS